MMFRGHYISIVFQAQFLALLDGQEEQLREELRELEHQLVGATDWNNMK